MKSKLIAMLAWCVASLVNAQSIFSCETTNGKLIQVDDLGSTIEYRFGTSLQTPELALSVPRSAASTWQWNGVGRYMSYSVTVPNGHTDYTVFFSVDRIADDHPIYSGVLVEVDKQRIAQVDCRPQTLYHQLEEIDLTPSE